MARRSLCLLLLLVFTCGCRRSGGSVGPYPQAPVVLISIDTLRADRLPLYGYGAGSTPAIDALGREGVVFEGVYSHCPLTLPAHASLFTGLLPPHHGVRDNIGFTLKEGPATLATRFKSAGVRTGGAVSAFVLRKQTGIARGFEFYDDAFETDGDASLGALQRDGAAAVESLARWIEGLGEARFFAFLHLYEPHWPYAPPERHRGRAQPYDGEVSYADELVGRFLGHLKARGLHDRAVIVLTADHGEGLRDHGEEEHGMFLYREAVHVPLVVRLPGGAGGGTRVAGTASQVDVAATIVDLARLDAAAMDGVSLRAALATGRVAAARPVYSETFYPRYHFGWSELFAVTDDRYRYIRAPRAELYDLGADPGEKTNLHGERTATAAAMGAWLEKAVRLDQVSAPEAVPAETREKLQALGYIGGGAPVVEGGELPDPKDKIGAYEDLRRALGLQRAGRGAEAVAAFRKVLAENPRMLDAWQSLGTTLIGLGRDREGIQALDKALEIDPSQADVHLALARVHALGGDRERATRHAEIASARDPGKGYEALAQLMLDKGRAADAAAFARKSIAADPARAMSHFILGVLAQAARPEEALASFRRAEEAIRLRRHAVIRNLHANMADCLARLGREAEAEREFLAEIEAIPHSREARRGLATLYWSQRRDAAARSVLAGLVQAEPRPSADTYWTVVETFSVLGDRSSAREWAGRARALFPSDPRFR